MKRRKISLPILLGICLILCSLCLVFFSRFRMYTGFRESQAVLLQIDALLPERTPGLPETYPDSGMPILEIDGADYAALLEIPSFGVTLPVADHWDSQKLARSPARFSGSAYDHTLVIGGADDPHQFAFCDQIEHGALVTLTDMTGAQFSYTVSRIDRAKHAEAQWLTDAEYDLTLFCRDTYSMEYIAVRCVWAYQ